MAEIGFLKSRLPETPENSKCTLFEQLTSQVARIGTNQSYASSAKAQWHCVEVSAVRASLVSSCSAHHPSQGAITDTARFIPRQSDHPHRRDLIEEPHQINFSLPEFLSIEVDGLRPQFWWPPAVKTVVRARVAEDH